MVGETVQNYVAMVSGLTRTTREKAMKTARALLSQSGLDDVAADAQERVTKLADEIVHAGKANRELLEKLVSAEVDRAASRLGFARSEDVDELRRRVAELSLAVGHVPTTPVDESASTAGGPVTTAEGPAAASEPSPIVPSAEPHNPRAT